MSFTRTITFFGLFWLLTGSSLVAQNAFFPQNHWETLPVFHDGRVMPLHTFARKIVREICGTERPYIVRDGVVIAEFNEIIEALQKQKAIVQEQEESSKGYPFLIPNAFDGGFDRNYSIFNLTADVPQIKTALPIQGLDDKQVETFAARIKQLIPDEGRYFTADELLVSWICEPDVWAYIPIFLVPETDYLDEIFDVSFKGDVRTSQYRLSLYQLGKSQRYNQRRADMQRRWELGQVTKTPIPFDVITERLESQAQIFRGLTFHPQRQRPTRMLSLLYQIAGLTDEPSPYMSAFEAWGFLLTVGEVPGRQAIERSLNPDDLTIFHPTTQRWHDVAEKLRFLMQAYSHTDSGNNPVFPRATMIEQHYEMLIDLIDENLAEAAALMESVYPGVTYRLPENDHVVNVARLLPTLKSPENQLRQDMIRQVTISYYHSVKKLRNEIEAAYLALYDNGRSLRFLPVRSPLVLEMASSSDNFGVQPWASSAMVLGSGETFIRRFFDPQFDVPAPRPAAVRESSELPSSAVENAIPASDEDIQSATIFDEPKNEATTTENENENESEDALMDPSDPEFMSQLLKPFEMKDGILRLGSGDQSPIGLIRSKLRDVLTSFTDRAGGRYGSESFNHQADLLRQNVRSAATKIEAHRKIFVDEQNQPMVDFFAKTAYPEVNSRQLRREYRYDRWAYSTWSAWSGGWMGIFALLAVLLNIASYATSATRSKSVVAKTVSIVSAVQGGKKQETELADYTNTVEEWLFISSVVMLLIATAIAFIGAMMRAGITGWAPVTNMYEIIVMMAFAAAMIGIWYSLSPLLHPAWKQAWALSKFPRIGTILEWFAAQKAQKAVAASLENDGEAAMREAAMELGGMPGGRGLGGHYIPPPQQDPEEIAAQQRVRAVQRKMAGQCVLAIPRLILTIITFSIMVSLANGGSTADQTFFAAAGNMFATNDVIDFLTVAASVLLILWFVPHVLVALCVLPAVLSRPAWVAVELGIRSFEMKMIVEAAAPLVERSQTASHPHSEMSGVFHGEASGVSTASLDTSGTAWIKQARNAVLDRKLFIAITAAIVFLVCIITAWNRAEFNPDIRPIAAVLRSNFWFTVHVVPLFVSLAAAAIAWGMAAVSLGFAVFGRYRRFDAEFDGERRRVMLPELCLLFAPTIERLLKIALLLLIVGTVLGARWADYSWGRFWSWDPKEVWALITILLFAVVLHGKVAKYYGAIGITVGALLAFIAWVITIYGVNFVFKGSVHAYGGGAAGSAAVAMWSFIIVNLLWGILALLRYHAEVYGSEIEEAS